MGQFARWRRAMDTALATADVKAGMYGLSGHKLPLIEFRHFKKGQPVLFLVAGFHGEEPSGPWTLARNLPELVRRADELGIGLWMMPCVNPEGFDRGERYNWDGDSPNNDFLRYRLADGSICGDLGTGNEYDAWEWSSDLDKDALPPETLAMHRALKHPVREQIAALVDIHQDGFMSGRFTYAYAFEFLDSVSAAAREAGEHLTVLSNRSVASGYPDDAPDAPTTNDVGLLRRHDGSLADLLYRGGVSFSVTVETTTDCSAEESEAVNLAWMRHAMGYVAEEMK